MGRPKKTIDYEQVEKLAKIFCTQQEIADFLGISVRTLQRDTEFCRVYKMGNENAKSSLRRNQLKLSGTNASMCIWLGKQYLNQRDHVEPPRDTEHKTIVFKQLPRKSDGDS